jgi:hypothetical protein
MSPQRSGALSENPSSPTGTPRRQWAPRTWRGHDREWSRLFQELTHGLNTGRVAWGEGHPSCRGETDVEALFASLVGGK